MKAIIATTALIVSTSTLAHDNSCDTDFNGNVSINQSEVAFSQHSKPLYKIVDDEYLIINGETIGLSSKQQALVTEYSEEIKAMVPKVKSVAIEGMDLAVDGVNLAFDELLGEGNDLGRDLTESLNEIRTELEANFSLEKGIQIDEDGFTGEEMFGDEFEERIETVMEDAIQNSIGTLLIAVGQEMLFSGGDMDAFETRMENFGEQIEHEMESRAESLEQSAEKLCKSLESIDELENQMVESIDELSDFDLLRVDNNTHKRI